MQTVWEKCFYSADSYIDKQGIRADQICFDCGAEQEKRTAQGEQENKVYANFQGGMNPGSSKSVRIRTAPEAQSGSPGRSIFHLFLCEEVAGRRCGKKDEKLWQGGQPFGDIHK